ncbi:MAG: hypothetical protein H6636_05465 [Anaerolineales bacterium]|nr:hypothetical protein [Anaerolineales bacterium]
MENVDHYVSPYKKLKIGVVGYSRTNIDEINARALLQSSFKKFITQAHAERLEVEIVSGLTNAGVPKIAYELATQWQLKTVGISAREALEATCGVFPVRKQMLIGETFGDESSYFIQYIDCLTRVGGGNQSLHEVEMFKEKLNHDPAQLAQWLIEHELELL